MDEIWDQLDLGFDGKHMKLQISMYVKDNLPSVKKLSKNFLHNKGINLDEYLSSMLKSSFEIDELFLVLMARHYTVHVCVLLSDQSTWSTTPWIKLQDCPIVFICCNKTSGGCMFIPTAEQVIKESTGDGIKMKAPDSTLFQEEMKYFIQNCNADNKISLKRKVGAEKIAFLSIQHS